MASSPLLSVIVSEDASLTLSGTLFHDMNGSQLILTWNRDQYSAINDLFQHINDAEGNVLIIEDVSFEDYSQSRYKPMRTES